MRKVRDKNTQKFLNTVYANLKKHGISLRFTSDCRSDGFRCAGYFDSNAKEIVVRNRRWLPTLVHEYSHFIQWRDGHPSWNASITKYSQPEVVIEKWLKKKIHHSKNLKRSFVLIRRNEIECDILAAKLIKRYKLPVDLDTYRRDANYQAVFYHCVELKRKWTEKDGFFSSKNHRLVPKTIRRAYAKKIPDSIINQVIATF